MNIKYIVSEQTSPYINLATERALFGLCSVDTAVLFLWQNDNTIVVGRNQSVSAECRAEEFMRQGGRIARRLSGGGAVFHDLGNLNYSVITSSDTGMEICSRMITGALGRFGIAAEFNGRNDFLAQGRKFSGNAQYSDGSVSCLHGTLMLRTDIEKMTRYLTPDSAKLARNGVKSVASRVVDLCGLSGEINVQSMREALIEAAGAVPLEALPDAEEADRLCREFSSEDWIFGGKR